MSDSSDTSIAEKIRQKCLSHLSATHCECLDLSSSGCGTKLELTVVSEEFKGKRSLACHRIVNTLLKEEIASIHAITLKTWTPVQWEEKKGGQ
mmetsp:Transcript_45406/g.88722  ORF Transcript_45406/g.88722 Transcript_45406/m.88722 type:complete len:93 (-) Transcript_45406:148-426(-)